MSDTEIRDRLIRLETIVGDEHRGVLSELRSMRAAVDDLKAFQFKLAGAVAALGILWQVLSKLFIR